jgi:hypothetical protein
MTVTRTFLLGIFIFTQIGISAQESDSVRKLITRSIERSISRGHDRVKCKDFSAAVFSIFITFSAKGKVEDVFFNESTNCFNSSAEPICKLIEVNVDNLNLERSKVANSYIVAIAYLLPPEAREASSNKAPADWSLLFKGVDFKRLKGKDLMFCIPLEMYLLPRIEN